MKWTWLVAFGLVLGQLGAAQAAEKLDVITGIGYGKTKLPEFMKAIRPLKKLALLKVTTNRAIGFYSGPGKKDEDAPPSQMGPEFIERYYELLAEEFANSGFEVVPAKEVIAVAKDLVENDPEKKGSEDRRKAKAADIEAKSGAMQGAQDQAMAAQMAKLTPEQRAQYEAMQGMGGMPAGMPNMQGAMQGYAGMMKSGKLPGAMGNLQAKAEKWAADGGGSIAKGCGHAAAWSGDVGDPQDHGFAHRSSPGSTAPRGPKKVTNPNMLKAMERLDADVYVLTEVNGGMIARQKALRAMEGKGLVQFGMYFYDKEGNLLAYFTKADPGQGFKWDGDPSLSKNHVSAKSVLSKSVSFTAAEAEPLVMEALDRAVPAFFEDFRDNLNGG